MKEYENTFVATDGILDFYKKMENFDEEINWGTLPRNYLNLKNNSNPEKNAFMVYSFENAVYMPSKLVCFADYCINRKSVIIKSEDSKNNIVNVDIKSDGIDSIHEISRFDLSVHNAICTLVGNGYSSFLYSQIARVMFGSPSGSRASQSTIDKIEQSVKKLSAINLIIKYSSDNNINGEKVIEGFMIPANNFVLKDSNDNIIPGCTLTDFPPIFKYSCDVGRICSLPYSLLKIDGFRNSIETIIVRDYLLMLIEYTKYKRKKAFQFDYQQLFEECHIIEPNGIIDKNKKFRYVKHIKQTLDFWIGKKYIKSYEEIKYGKTFVGIKVYLK